MKRPDMSPRKSCVPSRMSTRASRLTRAICILVDVPHQLVLIRQQSSLERKELQAVDAVAWAFFQTTFVGVAIPF